MFVWKWKWSSLVEIEVHGCKNATNIFLTCKNDLSPKLMLVHSNKVDLSYEWHIFPNLKLIIRFPGKTNYKVPRDNLSIPKFLKNNLCLQTWICPFTTKFESNSPKIRLIFCSDIIINSKNFKPKVWHSQYNYSSIHMISNSFFLLKLSTLKQY